MAVAELVAQPPVEQSLFLADFTDYLLPNPEYFDEGQAYIDSDKNRVEMIGQQILKSGIDISFLADMEPTSLNLGRALYLLTIFRINEMLEINEKQREEIRMLYSYYMPRKRWNIVGRIVRRLTTLDRDLLEIAVDDYIHGEGILATLE